MRLKPFFLILSLFFCNCKRTVISYGKNTPEFSVKQISDIKELCADAGIGNPDMILISNIGQSEYPEIEIRKKEPMDNGYVNYRRASIEHSAKIDSGFRSKYFFRGEFAIWRQFAITENVFWEFNIEGKLIKLSPETSINYTQVQEILRKISAGKFLYATEITTEARIIDVPGISSIKRENALILIEMFNQKKSGPGALFYYQYEAVEDSNAILIKKVFEHQMEI